MEKQVENKTVEVDSLLSFPAALEDRRSYRNTTRLHLTIHFLLGARGSQGT